MTFILDCAVQTIAGCKEAPIASDLRFAREWLQLSQNELAKAIGFRSGNGGQTVRSWEAGEIVPTPTAWAAFRYLLGLTMEYRHAPTASRKAQLECLLPKEVL